MHLVVYVLLLGITIIYTQFQSEATPVVMAREETYYTPLAPFFSPLHGWWSLSRGDNFATTQPSWVGSYGQTRSPDYNFVRPEGYVFSLSYLQPKGTVPLYSWHSPSREDNFLTSDPNWAGEPGDSRSPDYGFVRVEGYIYDPSLPQPPGTLPLYSWYSPSRGDNFATTHPSWVGASGQTRSPDYQFVRLEGYVLSHPSLPMPDSFLEEFGFGQLRVDNWPAVGVPPPAQGTRPLLVILIDYADVRFHSPHTREYYERLIFGPAEPNVTGYYREMSYGAFEWENAGVIGPLTYPDNPSTPVNESLFHCASNHFSGTTQLCPGASGPWEQTLTTAIIQASTAGGVNFADYDANGDGNVTTDELNIVVFGANPRLGSTNPAYPITFADSGAARWAWPSGCVPVSTSSVNVCVKMNSNGEGAGIATITHELSHAAMSTIDIYGSGNNFELSLMGATIYGVEDSRKVYHLDPWHKMRIGWLQPRIYRLTDQGSCTTIAAAQNEALFYNNDLAPLILYDPGRGTNEYFIMEFRTPETPTGGGYDANVADRGVAVWYIKTDSAFGLPNIPGLGGGFDKPNLAVGAPGGSRGGTRLWRDTHGVIPLKLALDNWISDAADLHLRVGPMSPTPINVEVEWGRGGAFVPHIEHVQGSLVGGPGSLIVIEGNLGVAGAGRTVSLRRGNDIYDLEIVSWTCQRVVVRIPPGIPSNNYQLVIFNDETRSAASNPIPFTISPPSGMIDPILGGTLFGKVSWFDITIDVPTAAVPRLIEMRLHEGADGAVPDRNDVIGELFSINAIDVADQSSFRQFDKPFSLSVGYDENNLGGVDETKMGLFFWDEVSEQWVEIPGNIDPDENLISAELDHLTTFAIRSQRDSRVYLPIVMK